MANEDRYILFTGAMQPTTPMLATPGTLSSLSNSGHRQGKDYNVVSLKVLMDSTKQKKGGSVSKYSKGGGVRVAKYKV